MVRAGKDHENVFQKVISALGQEGRDWKCGGKGWVASMPGGTTGI